MRFLIHDHEADQSGYEHEGTIDSSSIVPVPGDLVEISGKRFFRVNTRRFSYDVAGGDTLTLHVTKADRFSV